MSRATGEVVYAGKVIGYFSYNGTADVCCTKISPTAAEVWAEKVSVNAECECGKTSTPVILYTDYAEGFYWLGEACLNCKAITAGLDPFAAKRMPYNDGHPLRGVQEESES